MNTYITWKEFKEKVDSELANTMLSEDTPVYQIDLHPDRNDEDLAVYIDDGMLVIGC